VDAVSRHEEYTWPRGMSLAEPRNEYYPDKWARWMILIEMIMQVDGMDEADQKRDPMRPRWMHPTRRDSQLDLMDEGKKEGGARETHFRTVGRGRR
jgi:hypothetical protein